jgi:nicotinamide-nucleotide amidase
MRGLFADELLPRISALASSRSGLSVVRSRTLRTTGVAESALADQLGELARSVDGMGVAFLPGVDGVDMRLTIRDLAPDEADERLERGIMKLRAAAGRYVYGEGEQDLAAVVLDLCKSAGVSIAVAESCTGGMVGQRLTAVPGASAVFRGGVIAYDNSVKRDLLSVSESDLARHGAVSGEVALAMARGVRERAGAGIAIGITGVAGPGGGTDEKPVGMVWVALAGVGETSRCLRLFGTREEIRQRAAQAALDMVRRALQSG